MASNGLLLLTSSTRCVLNSSLLKYTLQAARKRLAAGVLYVYHWLPTGNPPTFHSSLPPPCSSADEVSNQIAKYSLISSTLYSQANQYCPRLDVRFLYGKSLENNTRPSMPIDMVMVELQAGQENNLSHAVVKNFVTRNFNVSNPDFEIQFLENQSSGGDGASEVSSSSRTEEQDACDSSTLLQVPYARCFNKVALGGTFDRMHNAHKILLTEAVLRTKKELIAGVTDDNMIRSKLLYELIEPCEKRVERVEKFLQDVAPHLRARVEPISNPFGPTITEEDIDFLVLSHETIGGGKKINDLRQDRRFPALDVHSIRLYEEHSKQSTLEEDKISSSSQRIRLLGDRVKPPRQQPNLPYVIGLTGGICSGKSTLCSYLETLGIPSINCDLLGHKAYEKGTQCFQQVVQTFGEDVLDPSGNTINRRALGAKVFANPGDLAKLNSIVWPEIRRLVLEKIQSHKEEGAKAVVLDAAVLLEANWDELCHDVWVVIIPKEEAIKRIQERDKLSKEDAERRVLSQVSNHERVKRATFVFSSMWELDFTRRQANKAWLQIRTVIDSL